MDFEQARSKAIKYIGISKKTKTEVYRKLKTLGVTDTVASKVIDYLVELEYLNDENYVNLYITQNERMLKYSIYEIKCKLKEKGIKENIIDIYTDKLYNNMYEKKVINKITEIKNKKYDEIKLKDYLYRRGFDIYG